MRKQIKSELVVEVRSFIREFYPGFTEWDMERAFEILNAIPREDFRREDLLISIDQAYSESHDTPRMISRKDFMQ